MIIWTLITSFGTRVRIDDENENDTNWQYAANFVRDFNRRGQNLKFNIQYRDSNEDESSVFDDKTSIIGLALDDLDQRANNNNGQTRTIISTDYTHPFSQSGNMELGFRYSFRNIFNSYQVDSDSTNIGSFEEVTALTNDFNFDEKILATYAMISNKLNKFSWQIGARIEHTDLSTLLEQTNEENNQNYLSFFPSANMTFTFTDITSVQISYSRRVSRPRFHSLNPFVTYSDPLNLYKGNPALQPQFTDSYELGILRNTDNSSIYYGIYQRHTENVVQRIRLEENGITTLLPLNLAVRNDLGLELNVSKEFSKKFRSTGNFNLFNSQISGEQLSANTTTFSFRQGNYYRNPKILNAQISFWYRAPRKTTQGKRFGMSAVDIGLSKDIMKTNGTIAMNVRDLFNTRKYRGKTNTETFSNISEFQWRQGPTVVATFTYRINQKKKRERGGGGQEGEFEGGDF